MGIFNWNKGKSWHDHRPDTAEGAVDAFFHNAENKTNNSNSNGDNTTFHAQAWSDDKHQKYGAFDRYVTAPLSWLSYQVVGKNRYFKIADGFYNWSDKGRGKKIVLATSVVGVGLAAVAITAASQGTVLMPLAVAAVAGGLNSALNMAGNYLDKNHDDRQFERDMRRIYQLNQAIMNVSLNHISKYSVLRDNYTRAGNIIKAEECDSVITIHKGIVESCNKISSEGYHSLHGRMLHYYNQLPEYGGKGFEQKKKNAINGLTGTSWAAFFTNIGLRVGAIMSAGGRAIPIAGPAVAAVGEIINTSLLQVRKTAHQDSQAERRKDIGELVKNIEANLGYINRVELKDELKKLTDQDPPERIVKRFDRWCNEYKINQNSAKAKQMDIMEWELISEFPSDQPVNPTPVFANQYQPQQPTFTSQIAEFYPQHTTYHPMNNYVQQQQPFYTGQFAHDNFIADYSSKIANNPDIISPAAAILFASAVFLYNATTMRDLSNPSYNWSSYVGQAPQPSFVMGY